MEEDKFINEGGINGTGKGLVNTNSKEFQILRQKIEEASEKRNSIDRIEDRLLGIRFRMEGYLREDSRENLISAGQFLRECIEALNIKNKRFAAYIGYEESNLSALCHGRRKITPELALKLAKIIRIPAEYWLGIQNIKELDELSKQKESDLNPLNLKDLLRKSA